MVLPCTLLYDIKGQKVAVGKATIVKPKVLGNIACNFKKIPTLTQDLSRRCIATRGGVCVSTYPHRPKAEALG